MTVTIQKKTTKATSTSKKGSAAKDLKKQLTHDPVAEAVDAAAGLDLQIAELKAQLKGLTDQQAKLIKEVKAANADALADTSVPVTIEGDKYAIVFSAGRQSRVIKDKEGLYHAIEGIQEGLFFDLCDVSLSAIDKTLSEDEASKYIEKVTTESRTLKYVPKA